MKNTVEYYENGFCLGRYRVDLNWQKIGHKTFSFETLEEAKKFAEQLAKQNNCEARKI